jgi:membrane protease YdiL (CAAX protease family)
MLVPLTADAVLGRRLDAAEVALRTGALALPVLLVTLATRDQRRRLSFLFVSAILVVWFAAEFGTVPQVALPPDGGALVYMRLALVVLFLFVLARAGWLPGAGYSFALTRAHWREIATNLALLGATVLPLALATGFIRPSSPAPPSEMAARAAAVFLFVALPEELLFRGTIQRYLAEVLCWSPGAALGAASLIFGAAHLNNPPGAGWYAVLASLAGVFYGRTYSRTGNVVAAAIVHAAVDWTWAVFFRP